MPKLSIHNRHYLTPPNLEFTHCSQAARVHVHWRFHGVFFFLIFSRLVPCWRMNNEVVNTILRKQSQDTVVDGQSNTAHCSCRHPQLPAAFVVSSVGFGWPWTWTSDQLSPDHFVLHAWHTDVEQPLGDGFDRNQRLSPATDILLIYCCAAVILFVGQMLTVALWINAKSVIIKVRMAPFCNCLSTI